MPQDELRVLVVNPGSTSTKFAVYDNSRVHLRLELRHTDEELAPFRGRPMLDQAEFRTALIEQELGNNHTSLRSIQAFAGRGGLLPPVASGTYTVDDCMITELTAARRGEHASNLGAVIAKNLADRIGAPAYVVDPVSVDEWPEFVRLSGSPLLERQCLSHALNTKAVAKRFATEKQSRYEDLRLIIAHLGSGISVSAHAIGRMIDVTNSREEGAFSTERAGTVPCMKLVELCFSGKYSQKEVEALLFRDGGLYAYLGTKNLEEIERRIDAGDHQAVLVYRAMVYQIAKEIGAMATTLEGRIDAILLTGGMARSTRLVRAIEHFVRWIATVHVYPGEDELQALAEGVMRVLRGEEIPRTLGEPVLAAD